MKNGNGTGTQKKGERLDELRQQLGRMQRDLRDEGIPLVIVFEGLDYWGMADDINELIRWLDPRGCDFNYMMKASSEEKQRPFICRYFQRMPARGRIGVFDRSWYFWSIYDHYKTKDDARLARRLDDIRMLERQHHDDGFIIIKFFLDLDEKERKKRRKNPDHCEGKFHLSGEEFIGDMEQAKEEWKDVLRSTDAPYAPWIVIEEKGEDETAIKILESLLDAVNRERMNKHPSHPEEVFEVPRTGRSMVLDKVDLSLTMSNDKYKEKLDKLQERLADLQCQMYIKQRPSVIIFEGWDAAGKGGNILRITASLNPRGYRVAPVTAPNDEERSHHYLWRFYRMMPRDGMMTIFDRSWYGRVLVEKVEGLATPRQVERAYFEINEMERMLTEHGVVLMKFWLHIDKDEQMRRFQEREEDPDKRWKMTDDDRRNRSKWTFYQDAVEEMVSRTSMKKAPWTIVPSNDKKYSRVFVLENMVKRFENELS